MGAKNYQIFKATVLELLGKSITNANLRQIRIRAQIQKEFEICRQLQRFVILIPQTWEKNLSVSRPSGVGLNRRASRE